MQYHPDAGFGEGYLGSLTDSQQKALGKIRDILAEKEERLQKHLCGPGETLDHMFLRFLRARSFDPEKAADLLANDLEWREENKVAEIKDIPASEVLGCDESLILEQVPQWHQGFDKQHRPVIWKEFGHCETWRMLEVTTVENLGMYHVKTMESFISLLSSQSETSGYNIEQLVFVIDAKGWHLGLATPSAYAFLKMTDVDNLHYPERLGKMVIINSPWALSIAWKVIRSWLDTKTQNKIEIVGGPSSYEPILKSLIDEENIPKDYGGTAESLKPN